jgi:hypothetical protein
MVDSRSVETEVVFFAYRVEDLRRGFRAAAKALAENGLDRSRRQAANLQISLPLLWGPSARLIEDHAAAERSQARVWKKAFLSIVRAHVWGDSIDGLVSALRRPHHPFYLDMPEDRSPEAQLPPRCSGELRSRGSQHGYGQWESVRIELPDYFS